MKTLNRFIIEKLKLGKNVQINKYHFYPKDFDELRSLLEQLLEERGQDADLNDIDVSKVDSFYDKWKGLGLFQRLDPHNIKMDKWDVSNVKNMKYVFWGNKNFNSNLSNWDVSNVKDMHCMFQYCSNFTGQGLENWNVHKVTDMENMFTFCKITGKELENWNVENVINMKEMFRECKNLNCDLSKWNISNVKNMNYMFIYSSQKNKPSWYKGG